jgi:ELWxxDGT repeat protein
VRLVSDRYPGHGSSRPHELIDVGGTLYYQGIDPVLGYALFRTDGTAAGTSVVKDYLPGPFNPNFVNPYFANTGDGRVFYSDGDGTSTGRELYVTDGTAAGTRLVKDILPGVAGSSPAYLAAVGGTVFFAAQGSTAQGVELWKSDGTAAGTVLVKNIHSDDRSLYSSFSSNPANLTAVNGAVYFAANDGVNGTELWRTDGTAAGTVMYDLYAGSSSSNPQSLIAVGSTLFFVTQGGSAATLWRVAPGDAKPVAIGGFTVVASSGQRGVQNLASVNGTLYFAGDDGTHGMEVWKSDGTAAGTVMIKDIRTVPDQQNQRSSSPGSFMAAGNYVVFYADDGVAGRELWRTDGTAAGTTLLKDIYPNKFSDSVFNGSSPFPRVTYNGQAYFTATDDTHGTELWRTDGTPAGTVLVKDVWPGSKNSGLNSFGVAGGRLFFSADDGGGSGAELWTTDGTDAGTIRAADLSPGAGSSQPARFMDVNGAVVFFASDGVNGPSLFRFEPEDVKPTVVGTRFARVGGKAAVVVDFDEDVAGSLAGTDLVVTNLTTGQVLDPAAFTVAYDAANNRATFTLGSGLLADGNYRVTLAANGVRDTSDNPLAADGALDFFVLAGDVNGDRVVNFNDLLVLAKNYGRSGVGLAEGDFDGDGVVNFADLLMLAKNYNRTLDVPPPPPAPAPVMAVAAALPMATKRQASPAKPLFSTRPVVARPAPAKGKGVTAAKRGL